MIFNFVLLFLLLVGVWQLRKKQRFDPGFFWPMVVESAFYAFFLGAFIVFIIQHTMPMADAELANLDPLTKITISLGAGVYEELLFRLCLISLFTYIFVESVKVKKATAVFGAFLISSLLFSLAHFVGRQVSPYEFIYLFIAGFVLAVLFKFRSFAIAVYTHAFYDMFVLFSR
jgi:membrane protease YdiL (CAAX protease family)